MTFLRNTHKITRFLFSSLFFLTLAFPLNALAAVTLIEVQKADGSTTITLVFGEATGSSVSTNQEHKLSFGPDGSVTEFSMYPQQLEGLLLGLIGPDHPNPPNVQDLVYPTNLTEWMEQLEQADIIDVRTSAEAYAANKNKKPVANDDTQTLSADDEATVIKVLDNDTDPDKNDKLTVKAIDKDDTKGLVKLVGGVIRYDPNKKFNDVVKGKTATDTFSYTVKDDKGGTDTATVTITINGVKEKPVPVDCVVSWSEFSKCSASCGGGKQTRNRKIITKPENGGKACPELKESKACNTEACPTTPATTSGPSKKSTETKVVKKVMSIKPKNDKTEYRKGTDEEIIFEVTLICPNGYPAECSASECAKSLKECPGPSGGSASVEPSQVGSEGKVTVSASGWQSEARPLRYSWSVSCMGLGVDRTITQNTESSKVEWVAPFNDTGKEQDCTLTVEVEDANGATATATTELQINTETTSTSTLQSVTSSQDSCPDGLVQCSDGSCKSKQADCQTTLEKYKNELFRILGISGNDDQ